MILNNFFLKFFNKKFSIFSKFKPHSRRRYCFIFCRSGSFSEFNVNIAVCSGSRTMTRIISYMFAGGGGRLTSSDIPVCLNQCTVATHTVIASGENYIVGSCTHIFLLVPYNQLSDADHPTL